MSVSYNPAITHVFSNVSFLEIPQGPTGNKFILFYPFSLNNKALFFIPLSLRYSISCPDPAIPFVNRRNSTL